MKYLGGKARFAREISDIICGGVQEMQYLGGKARMAGEISRMMTEPVSHAGYS